MKRTIIAIVVLGLWAGPTAASEALLPTRRSLDPGTKPPTGYSDQSAPVLRVSSDEAHAAALKDLTDRMQAATERGEMLDTLTPATLPPGGMEMTLDKRVYQQHEHPVVRARITRDGAVLTPSEIVAVMDGKTFPMKPDADGWYSVQLPTPKPARFGYPEDSMVELEVHATAGGQHYVAGTPFVQFSGDAEILGAGKWSVDAQGLVTAPVKLQINRLQAFKLGGYLQDVATGDLVATCDVLFEPTAMGHDTVELTFPTKTPGPFRLYDVTVGGQSRPADTHRGPLE